MFSFFYPGNEPFPGRISAFLSVVALGDKIVISLALCREMTIFAFANQQAEIAQLVEHQLPKLRVAGSNPVFRSTKAVDVRRTSTVL